MVSEQDYEMFNQFYNNYYYNKSNSVFNQCNGYFMNFLNDSTPYILAKSNGNLIPIKELLSGLQLYDFEYYKRTGKEIILSNNIFRIDIDRETGIMTVMRGNGLDFMGSLTDDEIFTDEGIVMSSMCLLVDEYVLGWYIHYTMTMQPRKTLKLLLDYLHRISKHTNEWYSTACVFSENDKRRNRARICSLRNSMWVEDNPPHLHYYPYNANWSDTPTPRSTGWYRQKREWDDMVGHWSNVTANDSGSSSTDVNFTIYTDNRSDSA